MNIKKQYNKGMNKEEILNIIKSLSKSKGFYGRLLNKLKKNPKEATVFLRNLEEKKFKNPVDLVMDLEC